MWLIFKFLIDSRRGYKDLKDYFIFEKRGFSFCFGYVFVLFSKFIFGVIEILVLCSLRFYWLVY